jgi:hypothetical protein
MLILPEPEGFQHNCLGMLITLLILFNTLKTFLGKHAVMERI